MQRLFLTLLLGLVAFAGQALAQQPTHTFQQQPQVVPGGKFGHSVAGMGNKALVGAPGASAAYLFDAATGAFLMKFVAPPLFAESGDLFGFAVAIKGDSVLIGAPEKDNGELVEAGAAYLFDATTGVLLHAFADPTPDYDELFGSAVAFVGNNVLIGSPFDGPDDAGAAYLFDSGSMPIQTFTSPSATPAGGNFGSALAAAGNNVLIGAPLENNGSGAAYLFTASSTITLANPTPAGSDAFGAAVAVTGNNLVVAAPEDDAFATNAGVVHIFNGTTGAFLRTISNPDLPATAAQDRFGSAVAGVGSSGLVWVGTPKNDLPGFPDAGSAHLLVVGTGALVQTLNNPAPGFDDEFGSSVAGIGNNILIGTPLDDASGADAGIAYYYASPNAPPLANAGADQNLGCISPAGIAVTLDGSASSDPDNDLLTYTWRENGNIIPGPITSPTLVVTTFGLGTHTIELTVNDGNGGTDTDDVVLILVGDTTPPIITLIGANPMTVECHTPYSDPGVAVSDACDPIPSPPALTGSVNSNVPGTYTITYTATDASGNNSAPTTRTVNVVDTTPPTITLVGANAMTVQCHTPYSDPGVAVSDACDPIPSPPAMTGSVNSNVPGTYTITYTATDASGNNSAPTTRTVNVVDTTPPAITLNGANPMTLQCGNPYSESGAVVSDACDPIPSPPVITGSVNSNVPGTYTITYTATDASGNSSPSISRIVNVECPLPHPFVLLAEEKILIDHELFSEGDIHSNDKIEFRDGNPSTHIGNLTALGEIKIRKNNTVEGDVTAGGSLVLDGNATITGTATSNATVASYPLPTFSFTDGVSDVTVPANGSRSLAPGAYHDVKVENGGNLLLSHAGSSGNYFFHKLELKALAKLSVDVSQGPVEINLVQKFHFDTDVEIVITPAVEVSARFVTFNDMGSEDLHIHERSHVSGNINAPNAKLILYDGVFFKGAVAAEEIEVQKNVTCLHHNYGSIVSLPKSSTLAADDTEESNESETATGVKTYQLEQNYPNPFNPETEIRFQLPEASHVMVKIFNSLGEVVRTLADGDFAAGSHALHWNARNYRGEKVQSGIYFCRMVTSKFSDTRKMILAK